MILILRQAFVGPVCGSGTPKNSTTGLRPGEYIYFQWKYIHHFASARLANPNKAWPPFSVSLVYYLNFSSGTLGDITCDSGTPKNTSVRLDPGELSSFQWKTCPSFCFCWTSQPQQGLTSIFCVFHLKIPIFRQALEETTRGSGTPKNFSVRLDPGKSSYL